MNKEDVANITGLYPREFPFTKNDFLRCQLGVLGHRMVDMTRTVKKKDGTRKQETTWVNAQTFHIKFFGDSWERVMEQFDKKGNNERKGTIGSDFSKVRNVAFDTDVEGQKEAETPEETAIPEIPA